MNTEKEKRGRNTKVVKNQRVYLRGNKWPVRKQGMIIASLGLAVILVLVPLTTISWAGTTKEANVLLSVASDHIQKAEKCLEDSLFIAFNSPHKSKALMHQRKKQIGIAVQLCQTVVEISPRTPKSAQARLLIADAFARLQKPDELINEQIELAFEDDVESAKDAVYGECMEKTVNDLKSVGKMLKFLASTNSKRISLPSSNLGQSFKGKLENMITDSELMRILGSDYSKTNQDIENCMLENMLVE